MTSCREHEVAYVGMHVDAEDTYTIHALKAVGFEKIVGSLTRFLSARAPIPLPEEGHCQARLFVHDGVQKSAETARMATSVDRFHADPVFSRNWADQLAEELTLNCCRRSNSVVVVSVDGSLQGYASCTLDADTSSVLGIGCSAWKAWVR